MLSFSLTIFKNNHHFRTTSYKMPLMKTEDFKLIDNKLTFNLKSEGQDYHVELPLNVEGSINPSQWYRNFSRKVKYAVTASGKELSPEETAELATKLFKEDAVYEKVRTTPSLWQGNNFKDWLVAEGIEDAPPVSVLLPKEEKVEPPRPAVSTTGPKDAKVPVEVEKPRKNDEQVKKKEPNTTPIKPKKSSSSQKVLKILGGILAVCLIAFGIYRFTNGANPIDPVPAGPTLTEDAEKAKALLENCVKLVDHPEATLKSQIDENRYLGIEGPYYLFIRRMLITGDLGENESIEKAAEKYIEEFMTNWEARCDCKLVYDCSNDNS